MIQLSSLLTNVSAAPEDVLVGAQIVYSQTEGAQLTVRCLFDFPGNAKAFCREPCDVARTLFWRPGEGAVGGPFSFHVTEGQTSGEVSVTFERLTKADSALYRCALTGPLGPSVQGVEVIVVNGEFRLFTVYNKVEG